MLLSQSVMNEVRQSLGEIPILEDELRKAAGDEQLEDESISAVGGGGGAQKLVTADGTYATQSAFSNSKDGKNEKTGGKGGALDKVRHTVQYGPMY